MGLHEETLQEYPAPEGYAMMVLEGKKVVRVGTLKTRFDNNSIELVAEDGTRYRMKVEQILKIPYFNDIQFLVVEKKVHSYLEICV